MLVLVSGGIDSAALLDFYTAIQRPIAGLFVDYGQSAARCEFRAATAVCAHYQVSLAIRVIRGGVKKGTGEVPSRNAFLLSLAAMERPDRVWGIALGVHSGTAYADCSGQFVMIMNDVLRLQQRPVEVLAPFAAWSKSDILAYAAARGVPVTQTYSCEQGSDPPCGLCASCADRKELDARTANPTDPTRVVV